MSEITVFACNACGKRIEVERYRNPPRPWIDIVIVKHAEPENVDLRANACSRHCAAVLIRNHTEGWLE